MTPLARSMNYLREEEGRWPHQCGDIRTYPLKYRYDFLGFGDIHYHERRRGRWRPVIIQVFNTANETWESKEQAIHKNEEAGKFLSYGRILLHGWLPPTKTIRKWRLKVREVR